ncbi:MAG: hypothetical protein ACYC61_16900 [Isosphaeraceae bacterium]
MPNGQYPGPVHPRGINRNGREYRYFFYDKHHKAGYSEDAQWLPQMTHDEEFAVFELAVDRDLSNDKGDLYGLRLGPEGEVMILGTREEEVAEFPLAEAGHAWHGYPAWPIMRLDRDRQQRKYPPPREVLAKMKDAGLITESKRRRLAGGKS